MRGISLALLALALRGWAVLVMLGVWGVRVAVARATEASDLKWTKVSHAAKRVPYGYVGSMFWQRVATPRNRYERWFLEWISRCI